ncbi:uncharacterized protein [Chaetodon trifascialis]|uniref:uncharacterized protein n=1 Tax=Chaetodon trifascialis TaxID=109706 RepID=UPI003991D540
MKAHCVLSVTIVVSVAMMGVMHVRKKELDKVDKRNRFEDIKLRVTSDVLGEYLDERGEMQNTLDKTTNEQRALEKQVNMIQKREDTTKHEVQVCQGDEMCSDSLFHLQKSAIDQLATIETEYSNLKVAVDKENASWTAEMETLHKHLQARSPVCDFLKKNSQAVSSLCGIQVDVEAPKKEEAKAETAKQEELSAEAPKQEEPKVVVLKAR